MVGVSMAEKSQQQEPSIEEILASISRIISEDTPAEDEQAAESAPPAPSFDEPAPEIDDFAPEPEPEPVYAAPPQFDPEPEPEPVYVAPPPPPPPPPPAPREDVMDLTNIVSEPPRPAGEPFIDLNRPVMPHQRLISDSPAMSSSEYFARLAIIAQERGQLGGSITVEEMSRELMRPMLQSWLDENLPGIVERLVQREIERIVRKAHDL